MLGANPNGSRIALITGASSGIGAAFARELASRGYDLILVARRQQRLAILASQLQEHLHINAEVLVADLADPDGIAKVEERITELGALDILVNNAGFGIPGDFAEIQIDRHLAMIQVHVLASVRFSRAALPEMIARGQGSIINVSSIGALLPRPGDVTYCATKAYLNIFSEALHAELRGTGVKVQALCPGFTRTEFLETPEYKKHQVEAKVPGMLWMSAQEVVAGSLEALREGRVICIPGFKNRLIVALARIGLTGLLLKVFGTQLR